MLDQTRVFEILAEQGVTFFTGVPDSYLNGFCNHALAHCGDRNVIAANEGNAVGIAAGHYLASGEIPLVYMQNSGMGNTVNPLVSLADPLVYGVPMLLLIGWRGQGDTEPNHPQHTRQGEITPGLLELMHIPYTVLEDDEAHFAETIAKATEFCRTNRRSYGLIAPKGVMAAADKPNNVDDTYPMSREEAIEVILDHMPENTVYAATTGRATRELFFLREKRGETKARDFLNVGSMGHASSVALGIALEKPDRPVVALDGDSAAIMHMGALTMVSKVHAPNFMHVVLNNGAHESVGGQPSAGHLLDFTAIAQACGYETVGKAVETREELIDALRRLKDCGKASFIDCRIHKGLARKLPPIVFDHREAVDSLREELKH
ncbi:MAG: phosphonopyruvate decarboxylase [Lachnospiraceae bacterium]|nr:phosphonopyruvate decarboxylase [Lachnospiraceae bacterium]